MRFLALVLTLVAPVAFGQSFFGTNITRGKFVVPNACISGEVITSDGSDLVCTSDITADDVNCSGCVSLTSEVTGILPVANGGTNLSAALDDNTLVGNGTTWESKALPSCSGGSEALQYNVTTNAFACLTLPADEKGYETVQEEGSSLTQRSTLNFIGPAVTAADNGGSTRTDVTVVASGTGACAAGTVAKTLNDGAAPTCSAVELTTEVAGILPVANGGTNLSAAADDAVMVGNATTWESKTVPDCNSTSETLQYDQTTNTFSCATIVLGSRQSVFKETTVDTTTTSVTFVPLLSQSITTTAGGILLVHFDASASNAQNNREIAFRLSVDASVKRATATTTESMNKADAAALTYRVTGLAPGAHTVLIEWKTSSGTAQIRPVAALDTEHASLLIEEVSN